VTQADYPLSGLKVLDFSRVLAGPFAGRMLSDLGADVVKVEPPDGDTTRLWGKVVGGVPGFYHQQNAGKRNICLDLRQPQAVELAKALAAEADVVIENFRPDVMPRLGLGWEALKAVNPRLVMLSISGFGAGGPESKRPAYAPIVQAELGLMDRHARRSGHPWFDLPVSVADTNAGLHGLVALLSALLMRERTGRGQHIDIAMMDATLVTDDQLCYEIEDVEHLLGLPNDVWQTGVGPILVSSDFRHFWRRLQGGHGLSDGLAPDASIDERIVARRAAVEAFMGALDSWEAVEAAMHKVNIAWGRVRRGHDLREQPTLKSRGSIAEVDDRAGGTRPIPQSPYRFSDARSGVRGGAPHRGEHNAEVLADWLGRPAEEAEALEAIGALQRDEERTGG
jgi:crotonobetainyl-CoA:carnitine CoA-transferase CaiB-like acyl-CoA transferase